MSFLYNLFDRATNIRATSDIENTRNEIQKNVSMRGYNLWILIASAMLACIGLDTNSTAIIIGAMLISPLMSPILGVGLSLGTHDNEMIRYSAKNLILAVNVSLLTAIVYFLLTPLGNETAEILARTKPTLLDVLVALFGGIAGIVSISRKDKTNAIPGVAIATALMPPICVSGFGIATGNLSIFLGAFYLFILNAVFISLATFSIVKYLKFPIKKYVDSSKQRIYTRYALLSVILLLVPGTFFLYDIYKENQFNSKINEIITQYIQTGENEVIKWNIVKSDSLTTVKFFISGNELSKPKLTKLRNIFKNYGLGAYKTEFIRINMSKNEIRQMSFEITQSMLHNFEIQAAQKEFAPTPIDTTPKYSEIAADLMTFEPNIKSISLGKFYSISSDTINDTIQTALLTTNYKSKKYIPEQKIYSYLKSKLKSDTLQIIFK